MQQIVILVQVHPKMREKDKSFHFWRIIAQWARLLRCYPILSCQTSAHTVKGGGPRKRYRAPSKCWSLLFWKIGYTLKLPTSTKIGYSIHMKEYFSASKSQVEGRHGMMLIMKTDSKKLAKKRSNRCVFIFRAQLSSFGLFLSGPWQLYGALFQSHCLSFFWQWTLNKERI